MDKVKEEADTPAARRALPTKCVTLPPLVAPGGERWGGHIGVHTDFVGKAGPPLNEAQPKLSWHRSLI